MFEITIFQISLALMCCWASAQTVTTPASVLTVSPTIAPECTIKCEIEDGYFADRTDAHWFYRCSHNKCLAHLKCQDNTVFSNVQKSCIGEDSQSTSSLPDNQTHNPLCPKPTGVFSYPSNPHKFVNCYENRATVQECPTDLVFNATLADCEFNDSGLTWDTDPTPVRTTASVLLTSKKSVETTKAATVYYSVLYEERALNRQEQHKEIPFVRKGRRFDN